MLYPARKLDRSWTGKVPAHMQLPGAPAGAVQTLKHSLGDKVVLSRAAREKSSVLLFTSKTLGPLAILSSLPHVLLSGAYGLTHFAIHFTVGTIMFLPWLVNRLRHKPAEMPLAPLAAPEPAQATTTAASQPAPSKPVAKPAAKTEEPSNDLGLPGFSFGGEEKPKEPENDLGLPGFDYAEEKPKEPENELGLPGFDYKEEKPQEPENELGLPGFDYKEEKPQEPENELGLPGYEPPPGEKS